MVKQLLDQKGNVVFQHLKNGRTAYAIASQKNNSPVMQIIQNFGAYSEEDKKA